jgi:nucleoside-diphosphate-sugar epimerase
MAKRKVLINGATGYIASQLLPRFREIYDLTLIDVKNTDPTGAKVPGATIADLNRYRELFRGIDTVVHPGFHRGPGRSAGTYTINTYKDDWTNVDMAYNVSKVAHEEGARRFVVASSNHAADWWEPLSHQEESGHSHARDLPALRQYEAPSLFFDFHIDMLPDGSPIVIHQDFVGKRE